MKGKLKMILTACLLACCFVLPIQADEVKPQCDFHKMEVQGKKKATCRERGYTGNKVCTVCGKVVKKGKNTPKCGHRWSKKVVKKSTCAVAGTVIYTCKVCNKTVTKSLPKKSHRYTYTDNKNGTHKASCRNCDKEKNCDHVYKKRVCVYCKAKKSALKKPVVTSLRNTANSTVNGVTISWKKVKYAESYEIYRVAQGSSYEKVGTTSNRFWTDVDVTNGSAYKYRVYALNKDGKSDPSVAKRICYVAPVKIDSLTNDEGRRLTVKWEKNEAASGYKIQYATKSNFRNAGTKYASSSTLTKTIAKLRKGRDYYVRICAYKKNGGNRYFSAWSPTQTLKIEK